MKIALFLVLASWLAVSAPALAAAESVVEAPSSNYRLMDVVETDESSASASLDRISGEIDLGFLGPDSSETYESDSHYGAGPFALSQRHEQSLEA